MKSLPEIAVRSHNPRKSRTPAEPIRILVVDDDPLYGAIVEQVAAQQNVEVHRILPSELEGLRPGYHAAIVDFDLGEIDGAEFSANLEQQVGLIPTVLVSSTNQEDLPKRKWPKSIIGFVPKAAGHMEAVLSAINLCQAKLAAVLSKD